MSASMPGDVVTALRSRDSHLLEAADGDVGRAQNWLPVNQRIRAQIKAVSCGIEAVVGVVKNLVEVIHAKQKLVGHAGSDDRIQRNGVVVDMDGRLFEVVRQIGTRGRKSRASP